MLNKIGFNRTVLSFLVKEGYTHIYNKGFITNTNQYILVPLKPGDPRIQNEEMDKAIEEITSNDVYDMADGVEFISFFVELLAIDFMKFNQQLNN